MIDHQPSPTYNELPVVDDAVLAEMSGFHGLTQAELWDTVGNIPVGNVAGWALSEASRIEADGVSAHDAFLGGVGYVLRALAAQVKRDNDKDQLEKLWGASFQPDHVDSPTPQ